MFGLGQWASKVQKRRCGWCLTESAVCEGDWINTCEVVKRTSIINGELGASESKQGEF